MDAGRLPQDKDSAMPRSRPGTLEKPKGNCFTAILNQYNIKWANLSPLQTKKLSATFGSEGEEARRRREDGSETRFPGA